MTDTRRSSYKPHPASFEIVIVKPSDDVNKTFQHPLDAGHGGRDSFGDSGPADEVGAGLDVTHLIDHTMIYDFPSSSTSDADFNLMDLDSTRINDTIMVPVVPGQKDKYGLEEVESSPHDTAVYDQSTVSLPPPASADMDTEDKKISDVLVEWRWLVAAFGAVISWKKPQYPLVAVFVLSILFLAVSKLPISTLSTFAIIGAVLAFGEWAAPIVLPGVMDRFNWNGDHQELYLETCDVLETGLESAKKWISRWGDFRQTMPRICSMLWAFGLLLTTVVLQAVGTLMVMYLVFMIILLGPGLYRTGMGNLLKSSFSMLIELVRSLSKPKTR